MTDHGLGHASRTVAIIRELEKKNVNVIIRSNDPFEFLKKSLHEVKIIKGQTDFEPIMRKDNGMLFNKSKTRKNLLMWIKKMPSFIQKESTIIQKIKPDIIVSDISFMPILAAFKNKIRSVLVSNFVWNESLEIPNNLKQYVKNSYEKADLILQLSLGTKMDFEQANSIGIVARQPTHSRKQIRKDLQIKTNEKLVIVSLTGKKTIPLKYSKGIKILDISNYSTIKKKDMAHLTEGQNLINAADLVICKCGYGFISECLTNKTRFFYVLEPKHHETNEMHKKLQKLGLKNRIYLDSLFKTQINKEFIDSANIVKISNENHNVAKKIMTVADRVI